MSALEAGCPTLRADWVDLEAEIQFPKALTARCNGRWACRRVEQIPEGGLWVHGHSQSKGIHILEF